jgi:hypothetical protein
MIGGANVLELVLELVLQLRVEPGVVDRRCRRPRSCSSLMDERFIQRDC